MAKQKVLLFIEVTLNREAPHRLAPTHFGGSMYSVMTGPNCWMGNKSQGGDRPFIDSVRVIYEGLVEDA